MNQNKFQKQLIRMMNYIKNFLIKMRLTKINSFNKIFRKRMQKMKKKCKYRMKPIIKNNFLNNNKNYYNNLP